MATGGWSRSTYSSASFECITIYWCVTIYYSVTGSQSYASNRSVAESFA
jgi:hypothetical protein